MPYSYSEGMKEAVASVNSTVAYILTYSFSHSTFPQVYRFCISDTDLIIESVTYRAKQIQASNPSIGKDGNVSINISISNVTNSLFSIFRKANATNEPVLVEPKMFIANQPGSTGIFVNKLFLKPVTWNGSDMSMQAGYPDTTNLKLPKEKYTTRESPGLRN